MMKLQSPGKPVSINLNLIEDKTEEDFIQFTFIALMADFVTDIILARDIGGFISIMENSCLDEKEKEKKNADFGMILEK